MSETRLIRELAGGLGRVILAWDEGLDAQVVVKRPRYSDDASLERARREATVLRMLAVPGVVPLRIEPGLLNIHIFRARQQLTQSGVESGARLVERRPGTGQVRFGIDRVEIVRL